MLDGIKTPSKIINKIWFDLNNKDGVAHNDD